MNALGKQVLANQLLLPETKKVFQPFVFSEAIADHFQFMI